MNKARVGDIRVIGLVAGTQIIEDIGMDVPHGVTVIIPGDLAIRSKDLWRALSQKCLFQLPSAGPPLPQPTPVVVNFDSLRAEARILDLEKQVHQLEGDKRVLRELLNDVQARESQKLDSILSALQGGFQGGGISQIPVNFPQPRIKEEVADGSAPTFIPSSIRSKDMDARIDVPTDSQTSDISDTLEKLRRARQGGS